MRRLVLHAVVLQVVVLLLAAVGPAAPLPAGAIEPVRLLLYGDSLTQGSTGDHTWRYFLDRHLRDMGRPFDLVGPHQGLHHVPGDGADDTDYAVEVEEMSDDGRVITLSGARGDNYFIEAYGTTLEVRSFGPCVRRDA